MEDTGGRRDTHCQPQLSLATTATTIQGMADSNITEIPQQQLQPCILHLEPMVHLGRPGCPLVGGSDVPDQ